MSKKLLVASLLWLGACLSAQAQIKAEHPRNCVMNVGPAQMMFSAFQEDRADAIFCRHIPEIGRTLIIVDAGPPELRDMNVEVRILRDLGQADWRNNLDETTVALLPAKKHFLNSSTASFRVDIAQEGKYFAVVRAFSDDGAKDYVGEYGFVVGESLAFYASLAIGALAFGFIVFGIWRRGATAPQSAPAPKCAAALACFRAKQSPVRVKKTHRDKYI
jgi:hypothetical protein